MYFQVNTALSVLYARNLLMTLLADWPAEGHVITAQLIGCKDSSQVPFVLDLLNHTEVKDAFEKVNWNKNELMESLVEDFFIWGYD